MSDFDAVMTGTIVTERPERLSSTDATRTYFLTLIELQGHRDEHHNSRR